MHLWNRKLMIVRLILAVMASWIAGSTADAAAPWEEHGKLRVSANGRHLEHADGTPMLWIADTGWALFYKLRREEVIEYLDERSRQGFNVIQAVAYYNSSNWFHSDAWLDFNGIETWKSVDKVFETVARDCSLKDPTKPTMLLEGAYEQGKYPSPGVHVSAHQARQQAYHTFFAGGAGHTYGGFPVWDFTRDPKNDAYQHTWHDAMKFPGAPQVATVLRRLFTENQWWDLAPQPSLIEGDPGKRQSRIVAMRSFEGNRILVYLPTNRAVKVELDLAGSKKATARWFDPRDGRETQAGDHACATTVDFKPPEGWEDAVLVVVGK